MVERKTREKTKRVYHGGISWCTVRSARRRLYAAPHKPLRFIDRQTRAPPRPPRHAAAYQRSLHRWRDAVTTARSLSPSVRQCRQCVVVCRITIWKIQSRTLIIINIGLRLYTFQFHLLLLLFCRDSHWITLEFWRFFRSFVIYE